MIDSNLWIYYSDATLEEHRPVRAYLGQVLRSDDVAINTVIQMEVAHYLIKRLGRTAGSEKVDAFLGLDIEVDPLDYGLVLESVHQLVRYSDIGIGGRDATILATLRRLRTDRLATHDRSFRRVEWVRVEDPLER
ncbi:MAG: type II toxin-antitoxin system VapC family toxin [Thermoplasmata archaeon]